MKSIFGLFISATLLMPIPCFGEQHNFDELGKWKTECVGRFQVDIPGEVGVALSSYKHFFDNIGTGEYRFSDDTNAPFSHLSYFGDLHVTSVVSNSEYVRYKNKLLIKSDSTKQIYLNDPSKLKQKLGAEMKPLTYNSPALFGWGIEDRNPSLYFYLEERIFIFGLADSDDELLRVKQFNSVLNNLRSRALYDIPKQPGVCVPYGFIADDGKAPRNIGVTMRLIDHPDVEVFFRDTSGYLTGGTLHSAKNEIEYFWTIMYQKYTKLTEADFWGYRSIKMGGQAGKGMFVTIHRYDDSIDYGYIAVVSDNANLPSQMLFVIRTASRAKGQPVSKEELKDMAEKIMSSVKPHAVQ